MRPASMQVLLAILWTSPVLAGPAPFAWSQRPGTVGVTLTTELTASSGSVGEPTSLAPDVAFGLTKDLAVSVITSTFGTSGFRGSAGRGICFTGASHGCPHIYDGAGIEALYSLHRGPLAVAADLGVYTLSFDKDRSGLKLGFKLRYMVGHVVVTSMPNVFVAATERDAMAPNRDLLWLPASVGYQITPRLVAGIAGGLKGPLDGLSDGYEIALGANAQFAVTPRSTVGASWAHGKIIGGEAALPVGTHGLDFRALHVWLTTSF